MYTLYVAICMQEVHVCIYMAGYEFLHLLQLQ